MHFGISNKIKDLQDDFLEKNYVPKILSRP